jgi:hypothetical protein
MAYILKVRQMAVAIAKAWVGETGEPPRADPAAPSRTESDG